MARGNRSNRPRIEITSLLHARHPIIQAPMAGVSTPRLAAAVSNAGALGSIAVGASPVEQARRMIVETCRLTDRPFNVNLFCHTPARSDPAREAAWLDYLTPWFAEFGERPPGGLREIYTSFKADPGMLEMLLEERPKIVSFHFGLPPAGYIEALRGAGIRVIACATSPQEALSNACGGAGAPACR